MKQLLKLPLYIGYIRFSFFDKENDNKES